MKKYKNQTNMSRKPDTEDADSYFYYVRRDIDEVGKIINLKHVYAYGCLKAIKELKFILGLLHENQEMKCDYDDVIAILKSRIDIERDLAKEKW